MYIVIELQKLNDVVANIVTQYDSLDEAYSKYFSILSVAAVSTVPIHSAVILDNRGQLIASRYFEHSGGNQ